jgi:WD40 repeat protein
MSSSKNGDGSLPPEQPQYNSQMGCSRRTFLIGGTVATLATLAGGGWWLQTRFSQKPTLPVDSHRIFSLKLPISVPLVHIPYLGYSWLPDSTHIAVATQQEYVTAQQKTAMTHQELFLVDVKSGQKVWKQEFSSAQPNTLLLNWSADGKHVVVVREEDVPVPDETPSGKLIVWPDPFQSYPFSFANDLDFMKYSRIVFSPDQSLVATTHPDKSATVLIWDLQKRRRIAEFQHEGHTTSYSFNMAWSPDSSALAVFTSSMIEVWHVSSGRLLWASDKSNPNLSGDLKWSPNGSNLAVYTTSLMVLDARTGTTRFEAGSVWSSSTTGGLFAWSPDSMRVACVTLEGSIQVWDVHSSLLLFSCQHVPGTPINISWSPDGKYLAAGNIAANNSNSPPSDSTIQIWDAQSGEALSSYRAPYIPNQLLWSPDSHFLATVNPQNQNDSSCHPFVFCHLYYDEYALQVFQVT